MVLIPQPAASMSGGDIESGASGATFMGDFFGQVASVKRTMEAVKANIRDLEDKQSKALTDVYGGSGTPCGKPLLSGRTT
jgi:hypothetical protein